MMHYAAADRDRLKASRTAPACLKQSASTASLGEPERVHDSEMSFLSEAAAIHGRMLALHERVDNVLGTRQVVVLL